MDMIEARYDVWAPDGQSLGSDLSLINTTLILNCMRGAVIVRYHDHPQRPVTWPLPMEIEPPAGQHSSRPAAPG